MRAGRAALGRGLPWLVLGAALVLATAPTWRPLLFGSAPSFDALLRIRCLPW